MTQKDQSERSARREFALGAIEEMRQIIKSTAERKRVLRRPTEPWRAETAWVCIEFLRDRAGRLKRYSVRQAADRLALEMKGYFPRGNAPSGSHLRNLHTEAVANMAADDLIRIQYHEILQRLRVAKCERGNGLTIPEYLNMPTTVR